MQRAFAYLNEIVRGDIYRHNRINLMTSFFYACMRETFRTMRATGIVRMHMIFRTIWLGNDRKMNAAMAF